MMLTLSPLLFVYSESERSCGFIKKMVYSFQNKKHVKTAIFISLWKARSVPTLMPDGPFLLDREDRFP